jgi:diguanylate cyclase
MPAAPFSPDESERQALLDSLKILDTAPEPVFDQVTRLTSRLLGVPIVLFSIVDRDRQWFKSHIGLDVRETPREQAFCAHAILQSTPLMVPDALADPRFSDNPLVNGKPNIRFYAGVPIRSSDGIALGTLCAIDSKPRTLSDDELQSLSDLADLVTKEIQYRETLLLARQSVERSGDVIARSEIRFRSVFDLASIGMAMVAPDGGWLRVNEALSRITGYSRDELHRMTFRDITYPPDLDTDIDDMEQLKTGKINQYQLEKRYVRKDGQLVWINLNVSKKSGPDGDILYYVAAIKDIQAQKEAEAALRALQTNLEWRVESRTKELNETVGMLQTAMARQQEAEKRLKDREAELQSVIANANDAYISLTQTGIVREWNRQAELTFGWTAAEAIGSALTELIIPNELAPFQERCMSLHSDCDKSTASRERFELPAICKDGSQLTVEARMTALEINGVRIFSVFLHDISARKLLEAQREYESRHDTLTGLLNRRALTETLPIAQARATRSGKALGLLFIDLDGFKAVNDRFGHEAGDKLLCEIGKRLQEAVRKTDIVFRLAGDEFMVILENISNSRADASAIANKITGQVSIPVRINSDSAVVGASIGIAIFSPGSSVSANELIKEADHRMYEAKKAGRGKTLAVR